LYGLAGVVGGIVLGILSTAVPADLLAIGLFFLAPLVWFSQWRYGAVVNLGPAVAFVGLLVLLSDSAGLSPVSWVGPWLVAGFVVLAAGLQAVLARVLAPRLTADSE
jgi:hypothetical protein